MAKQFEQLKKQYEDVPIPDELDVVVEQALAKRPQRKRKQHRWLIGAAAALALFTTSVNVSPSLAQELAKVPGLEAIIDVVTFQKYELNEDKAELAVTVPQITGDSADIAHLNAAYVEEGKKLYAQYKDIVDTYDTPYFSLTSDYKVVTDTADLLVLQQSTEQITASSYIALEYANLDRVQGTVLTLPQLFIDDRYIARISSYLVEKMQGDMAASNGELVYWVEGTPYIDEQAATFNTIEPSQSFFINEHAKLTISFNEGMVAPRFMGAVEIEIPTDVIRDLLVSSKYIR